MRVFALALNIALAIVVIAWLHKPPLGYQSHQRKSDPQATVTQHGVAGGTIANADTDQKSAKGHDQKRWIDYFLDHLPDWFVAAFTGLLAVVTYLLVKSTNRLWEAGERQIAVAQKSADAAVRSAKIAEQALRALERPYLLIERADNELGRGFIGLKPAIVYTVVNYGKTPAIVRSIYVRLQNEPDLPLRLPITNKHDFYAVAHPGSRVPRAGSIDGSVRLEVEGSEVGQIFEGLDAMRLVFHGSMHYEGPDGAYHIERFCLRAGPNAEYWTPEGGATYNCRKTEYPKGEPDETDT